MTFCRQSSHGGRVLLAAVIALGGLTPVFGQSAAAKAPVPDAAAQAEALKLIAEIFEQQWAGAKTTAQKTALAETMIEQAARTAGDPAGQFVLLRVARDVAAQSGDVTTAFAAIEMLDRGFAVDAVKMKTDALLTATKSIVKVEDAKVAAEESIALVRAAMAQDDYPVAEQLLRIGQSAARKSRDAELIRRLTDLGREMTRVVKAYETLQPALKVLDEKPTDPDANLTVGKFYCFVKGDWATGLHMLALGTDPETRDLARDELEQAAGTTTTEGQLALADGWWDLAQTREGAEKDQFLQHAGDWYRRVEPNVTGALDKLKLESRLKELEAINRPASGSPKPLERPPHYLTDMQEFDVKMGPWRFGKHGEMGDGTRHEISLGTQKFPYALGMHPPISGYSSVKYRLEKKYDTFVSAVMIDSVHGQVMTPKSPIGFFVLGNGKPLWSSAPVRVADKVQGCRINVRRVDVLELRVYCPGDNGGAHAAWLDPYVLEAK
ncbi:MAG: NPCBM/NEW2 domain-containing protein [Planctomycetes bacterium]|nr:NPCBM/NEW2 domain-containing protein [Planctomycetota bacterium]